MEVFSNDLKNLPPSVLQKANERIARALKKNAAMESEFYDRLGGKLEYCDLREIQDTITSKAWLAEMAFKFKNVFEKDLW